MRAVRSLHKQQRKAGHRSEPPPREKTVQKRALAAVKRRAKRKGRRPSVSDVRIAAADGTIVQKDLGETSRKDCSDAARKIRRPSIMDLRAEIGAIKAHQRRRSSIVMLPSARQGDAACVHARTSTRVGDMCFLGRSTAVLEWLPEDLLKLLFAYIATDLAALLALMRASHCLTRLVARHAQPRFHWRQARSQMEARALTVRSILRSFGGVLREIELEGCVEVSDALLTELAGLLPRLSKLSLRKCERVTDTGVWQLLPAPQLRSLDLSFTHIGDSAVIAASRMPRLEFLVLRHCVGLKGDGLLELARLDPQRDCHELGGPETATMMAMEPVGEKISTGASCNCSYCCGWKRYREVRLRSLDLAGCSGLQQACISAIGRLLALQHLDLSCCVRLLSRGYNGGASSEAVDSMKNNLLGPAVMGDGAAVSRCDRCCCRLCVAASLPSVSCCNPLAPLCTLKRLQALDLSDMVSAEGDDQINLAFAYSLTELHELRIQGMSLPRGLRPLGGMHLLRKLILTGCSMIDDDALRQLRPAAPHLRQLCLNVEYDRNRGRPLGDAALAMLLSGTRQLEILDASGSGFGMQSAAALASLVTMSMSATQQRQVNMPSSEATSVSRPICVCAALRELRLRKCLSLRDAHVAHLGAALYSHGALQVLDLLGSGALTAESMRPFTHPRRAIHMGGRVHQKPTLTALDLSWQKRMGPGLEFDACSFVRLRSLSLLGCSAVTDETVLGLRRTTSLTTLNLKWCNLVSDEAVSGCLARLPHLSSLNLKGLVLLTDRAMRMLAQGVTLASLTRLNVSLSQTLTHRGIAHLRTLPRLKSLLVSVCEDSPSQLRVQRQ